MKHHNHHHQSHHVLCNTTSSSTGISTGPLIGGVGLPTALPHQLSQLCNNQQYPLLALQQNFSHLLPPNYAAEAQQHFNNQHETFHHRNHHHHHHHHHHNNEHNPSHQARSHHNWRKSNSSPACSKSRTDILSNGTPHSLLDLSAKIVAEHIPFQSIEQRYEHIPEPVQRRIIFWSFPRHEDDIKMYSSLSSDTFTSNGPSNTSNTSVNQTAPSSSNTFSWMDQPNVQANTSQASNSVPTLRGNNQQKQLTFHRGLRLYNEGCVQDVLQVGFNLSGLISIRSNANTQPTSSNSRIRGNNHSNSNINNVQINVQNNNELNSSQNQAPATSNESINTATNDSSLSRNYRVSVTFDRCKITSVSCSCELQDIFWCEHVVALILFRIRNPETIDLRVPISETLLSLDRQQLQKLVQYIIAEHHTEVLPTAQRLLDEMRQSFSEINQIQGAPDPTAGARLDDEHIWHLDEYQVNEKVQNYLNSVCSNSKDAVRQINALFEKIREMFRAKDSNGTRLLRLLTEQFLLIATRNEKSRPLWDQLVSLWVVVMLNPDLPKTEKNSTIQLLNGWSRVLKCPKEDIERRVVTKRKAADLSDDEDSDDYSANPYCAEYPVSHASNTPTPAHMATHRHRAFQSSGPFPVLRNLYNQLPVLSPTCACQLSNTIVKKMRSHHMEHGNETLNSFCKNVRPTISNNHNVARNAGPSSSSNENRIATQEPRSVFCRALDFQEFSWDDPHLQLILNNDGPLDLDAPHKSILFDCTGNPLWNEPLSQAAARVETLRSHGYREQALRLTVASCRRIKLQQVQWCLSARSDSGSEHLCMSKSSDIYSEGWIGHPFDPINVLVDILLENSLGDNDQAQTDGIARNGLCRLNSARCPCPYNQALADFTQNILPDLTSLAYQHRLDVSYIPALQLPTFNPPTRRGSNSPNQASSRKAGYHHVPVPGCCQKDTYLTLAFELALAALCQQRSAPTIPSAHDRSVRQESELINKLESIDTSDDLILDILKHQTTLLLQGGPFHNSCCGVPTDSAPLHTFARYLFDSLVPHYPTLAYKVGVYALKMPLITEEAGENIGAARTSPRVNHNHLQSEQLALAETMLSKAKEEQGQPGGGGCLRKVYRASVKNIRNPASLLKLSKHVLKEAKPSGATIYPNLLRTSFDLGLQVLKITLSPHTSNGKTRREAIFFIVECATDLGLDAVLQLMKDSREYFSAIEALNLVVPRDNENINLRSQALSKLKLKENPTDLNRRCRELVLDCANRDPTNCALEALKFCEPNDDSLKKALEIVVEAGTNGTMDSSQLIKVADYIHERNMTEQAFEIAMVAVDSLSIPSNSDNSSSKKDIFSACEYAQKVNGFSTLIPKLINNIECATVLSEIHQRFCPSNLMTSGYSRGYDLMAAYGGNLSYNSTEYKNILNTLNNPEVYKQRVEDARWWTALLKRTLKAFVDTTRTRLQNISPRHYSEFIDFLTKAQGTFDKAPDGPQQFKDLISEIMKSYRTKKKLMGDLKKQFVPDITIKSVLDSRRA